MVIVLALAFFLSAIVTIYTLFRSGDTQVPNVVGRPETEAQKLAEQAGLRVKIQRRNDSSVPAYSVIETRPGPNSSVKKDSVLTIVVSAGPAQTKSELKKEELKHQDTKYTKDFLSGLCVLVFTYQSL